MPKIDCKITGVPKNYDSLPFGRQLDYRKAIEEFKASAKSIHFSVKRKTTAAGIREFKKLYRPVEWFVVDRDKPNWHDDSFQVWYKVAAQDCEQCGRGDAVMEDPTWTIQMTPKPLNICEPCAKCNIEREMYKVVQ